MLAGALFIATGAHADDEVDQPDRCSPSSTPDQLAWKRNCEEAIRAETDPAKRAALYFHRAFVSNGQEHYQEALVDLNAACALVPHYARYLHERAYSLNSLGRYRDALVDLNEEVTLRPVHLVDAYQERALSRLHLDDWSGALADRDQVVRLGPPSMGALVARAYARLWVGQFEEVRLDLKAAAALDSATSDVNVKKFLERVSGLVDSWTLHSAGENPAANCQFTQNTDFSKATLIGDCTLAFLAAKRPLEKAYALMTRGAAWSAARHSLKDMTDDYQAAAVLDPDNPDIHTNLGFAYIGAHNQLGARQEFDLAIEIRPTFMGFAGRAQANYNLGENKLALLDAQKSVEIKPNPAALMVLGDLSKTENDDSAAKRYWMDAYQLGFRGDSLLERLKIVGVTDPGSEPR